MRQLLVVVLSVLLLAFGVGGCNDNPDKVSALSPTDSPTPAVTVTETVTPPPVTVTPTPKPSPTESTTLDNIPKLRGYKVVASKWGRGSVGKFTFGASGSWRLLWAYECSETSASFKVSVHRYGKFVDVVDFFGVTRGYWNHDVDADPVSFTGRQRFQIAVPKACQWGIAAAVKR